MQEGVTRVTPGRFEAEQQLGKWLLLLLDLRYQGPVKHSTALMCHARWLHRRVFQPKKNICVPGHMPISYVTYSCFLRPHAVR
jgi:hypothetical protein